MVEWKSLTGGPKRLWNFKFREIDSLKRAVTNARDSKTRSGRVKPSSRQSLESVAPHKHTIAHTGTYR